jgi:hypothetical protein
MKVGGKFHAPTALPATKTCRYPLDIYVNRSLVDLNEAKKRTLIIVVEQTVTACYTQQMGSSENVLQAARILKKGGHHMYFVLLILSPVPKPFNLMKE